MKKTIAILATFASLLRTFPLVHAEDSTIDQNFSVVMISAPENFRGDSFVSIALNGLYKFGADNKMKTGPGGFEFKPNINEADYFTAFKQAMDEEYNLVIGLGDNTKSFIDEFSQLDNNNQFLLVDAISENENVASAVFKDYEAAYLAGIAAANESQTQHIGFVGGVESDLIKSFEQGFIAGVKEINENIQIDIQYLESFDDEEAGYSESLEMYNNGADIIYHAAGAAGYGVFEAAREYKIKNLEHDIFVIGADYNQEQEGTFEWEDNTFELTLTSTLKHVDKAIYELTELASHQELENKIYEYGMDNGGVDIAKGNLSGDTLDLITDYRNKMQSGELDVSEIVFE